MGRERPVHEQLGDIEGRSGFRQSGDVLPGQLGNPAGDRGRSDFGGYRLLPLPYDNSGKYNAPLGSDYFIAVSKDSKNKELATAWVDFFVKESGYVEDSGFMPIIKSAESSISRLAEFNRSIRR